jgi:type II secretory pathway pseudopilin PulG
MWLTLGLKALGIGKTLLAWGRDCLEWIFKDWRYIVIAILSLFAAYQMFSATKWQGRAEKAQETILAKNKTISDMKAASAQNAAKQAKAINDRKSKETQIAKDSDNAYKVANLEAGAAAAVYIDRWRVRNNEVCGSGAVAAPENEIAGVPETMPAGGILVSEGDVQACTGATAYAIEAHNHAMRQIAEGVAE